MKLFAEKSTWSASSEVSGRSPYGVNSTDTPPLSTAFASDPSALCMKRLNGVAVAAEPELGDTGDSRSRTPVLATSTDSAKLLPGTSVIDGSSLRGVEAAETLAQEIVLASSNTSAVPVVAEFLQIILSTRTALPGICNSDCEAQEGDSTTTCIEDDPPGLSGSALPEVSDCNRTRGGQ